MALDGPYCARPAELADAIAHGLRAQGRAAAVVRAESFWRDASVRLEYGHTDEEAYFDGWLDRESVTREVLDPLGPGGSQTYLPALRDPGTNRSIRSEPQALHAPAVLLLAGDLLLGRGLPMDLSIHLALSATAVARRTPPERQWTLSALARYESASDPAGIADIVVSWNDPARPARRC